MLLRKLRSESTVGNIAASMERMLLSYISLAQTSTETYQKSRHVKDIRFKDLPRKGLGLFNECLDDLDVKPAVLTIMHPLKRNLDYSSLISAIGFLPVFSITDSGISRPKIIKCQVIDY